ncbi:MAG TPA: twin-arginine translocase subunit TatC, partial [Pseudidiomarina sp.]|nr:twin-arginine translocase subunit TatC [Pseudidiomarina sp.]
LPLMLSSTLLFYAGIAFAYFIVLPLALNFLAGAAPEGVQVATDIARYLDFVLAIFLAFGIAFETPVAIILLCWSGVTSVQALRQKRPYVIVGAFVVGMFLTPPDVISQTLLAIPMWLLFELGVVIAGLYQRPQPNAEQD